MINWQWHELYLNIKDAVNVMNNLLTGMICI